MTENRALDIAARQALLVAPAGQQAGNHQSRWGASATFLKGTNREGKPAGATVRRPDITLVRNS